MSDSILRDKSKEFAKQIVIICRDIKREHRESILTNQLLRSGTSIGANVYEAQYAQGTKDFISKFENAFKVCHEAEYGLEWFKKANLLDETKSKEWMDKCGTIRRILVASINTTKSNMQN